MGASIIVMRALWRSGFPDPIQSCSSMQIACPGTLAHSITRGTTHAPTVPHPVFDRVAVRPDIGVHGGHSGAQGGLRLCGTDLRRWLVVSAQSWPAGAGEAVRRR